MAPHIVPARRGGRTGLDSFDYGTPSLRVRFGPGRRTEVGAVVAELGVERALVIATPGHAGVADEIAGLLGPRAGARFAGARMHTPVEATEAAMAVVAGERVDGLVAVGGGSAIGLGKAIARRTGLPQVAIPTTYAGSEMTDILGETEGGAKTTRRTEAVRPEAVIYDVELTRSLPPGLSAASGLNAIAHAVEALYARDGNPVTTLLAEEGVRALAGALPAIVADPGDMAARGGAQYGAWLCGTCLGAVSMALHHKLCHVLGGSFDLPHAETHAVVLPHAVAYNAAAAPEAMARLARALGGEDAAAALYDLAGRLGAPRALRDIGMPEDGIDRAVEAALANPYWNPRPLEAGALRALVAAAWAGRPPRA
jgi:maleylacetate reductase